MCRARERRENWLAPSIRRVPVSVRSDFELDQHTANKQGATVSGSEVRQQAINDVTNRTATVTTTGGR